MGRSMQVQLYIGGIVPSSAPPELVDALVSISVNSGAGQGGFQLGFAVSKNSVITQRLVPSGFFEPGNRVIIVSIIGGRRDVLMDGIITRQEVGPSDTPGASTFTVTGLDLTAVMDVVHWEIPWPALPPIARVAVICAKYAVYGITPLPVPQVFTEINNPIEKINVQSGTDLAYVNRLASDAGHVFFMDPGPEVGQSIAYWGPEVRFGVEQPALTINMGPASNTESASFSYDGLSSTTFSIRVVEPHSKIGVALPVPDVSLLRPPLALRPAIKLKSSPVQGTASMRTLETILLGLAKSSQASDAVTGQGKLDVLRYGHVLKARRLVGVRGAGRAYDGLYFVKSVSHEIKRGEYKQSFQLSRDGLLPFSDRVSP
jgi:hypothetical protein